MFLVSPYQGPMTAIISLWFWKDFFPFLYCCSPNYFLVEVSENVICPGPVFSYFCTLLLAKIVQFQIPNKQLEGRKIPTRGLEIYQCKVYF